MANEQVIVQALNDRMTEVSMHPERFNGDNPDELGWEEFVTRRHSDLVRFQVGIAYLLAQGARPILETQNLSKQRMAGAILRVHFTDKELTEHGRKEI